MKLFVDQAHKRGFNVFADVVYNHTPASPTLTTPVADRRGPTFVLQMVGMSPIRPGAPPNLPISRSRISSPTTPFSRCRSSASTGSGLTYPGPAQHRNTAEQVEGMNTLRQINRTLQFVKPGTYTGRDFSGNWLVAADLEASSGRVRSHQ